MMHLFRKWYYDNRDKIWKWIFIAIGIIAIIKIADKFYGENDSYVAKKATNTSTENTIEIDDEENTEYNDEDYDDDDDDENEKEVANKDYSNLESNYSIAGRENLMTSKLKSDEKIIDYFIDYCNDGNIEEAYNMISADCKDELYSTIEKFKEYYYNNLFSTKKTYKLLNWYSDTYKLTIYDDPITTGKTESNSMTFQDYMTVVEENDESKLNINNYIGKTSINKKTTLNGVSIIINYKKTYMDYELYNINIINTTDKKISLDTGSDIKSIYLLDTNNVKSYIGTGNTDYSNFELISGANKNCTLKFSNGYSASREMKYMIFEKVILNYEEYEQMKNKSTYSAYTTLTINL